jgi:hypothetical protein
MPFSPPASHVERLAALLFVTFRSRFIREHAAPPSLQSVLRALGVS